MRLARRVRPGPVASSDQLCNSSPILVQHLVSPIVVLLPREPLAQRTAIAIMDNTENASGLL